MPGLNHGLPYVLRFWSKVDFSYRCWLWRGGKNEHGYGVFESLGETQKPARDRGLWKAHRVALTLARGPIPRGKLALHHCDEPACVNPAHLYVGTYSDNRRDAIRRGRAVWNPRKDRIPAETVRSIRDEIEAGAIARHVARKHGVSEGHVSGLRKRKYRKEVL